MSLLNELVVTCWYSTIRPVIPCFSPGIEARQRREIDDFISKVCNFCGEYNDWSLHRSTTSVMSPFLHHVQCSLYYGVRAELCKKYFEKHWSFVILLNVTALRILGPSNEGVWTCIPGVFWGPQNSHFWGGFRILRVLWFIHTHRIHGTGIFTYIYHKNQPNVGIYIPVPYIWLIFMVFM